MTKDWLTELAPVIKTAAREERLPVLLVGEPINTTRHLDELVEKLAAMEILGREMAHEHPDLIKVAAIPTGVLNAGKTVANKMIKAPGNALRLGGAAAGGTMGALRTPGIDPNTGQQRSRLGAAVIGGAAGYGAGAMAGKSPALKKLVQSKGTELKGAVQETRAAQKAARTGGLAAGGAPSAPIPTAGGQGPIVPSPGAGVPVPGGGFQLSKPSTWFKQAEVMETNEGLVDHAPLSGPGKQSAPTGNKEFGKTKRALALPAGLMTGAKALGRAALKRPGAAAAAGGAVLGAAAGGPDHRLGGAALGAGAGLGLQRSGALNGAAQKLRGAVGGGGGAAAARTVPGAPAAKTLGGMGGAGASARPMLVGGSQTAVGAPELAHLSQAKNPELLKAQPHYPGDSHADVMSEWGVHGPEHQQAVERYLAGSGQSVNPVGKTQLAPPGTMPGMAPQVGGTRPQVNRNPRTMATRQVAPQSMNEMIQPQAV